MEPHTYFLASLRRYDSRRLDSRVYLRLIRNVLRPTLLLASLPATLRCDVLLPCPLRAWPMRNWLCAYVHSVLDWCYCRELHERKIEV